MPIPLVYSLSITNRSPLAGRRAAPRRRPGGRGSATRTVSAPVSVPPVPSGARVGSATRYTVDVIARRARCRRCRRRRGSSSPRSGPGPTAMSSQSVAVAPSTGYAPRASPSGRDRVHRGLAAGVVVDPQHGRVHPAGGDARHLVEHWVLQGRRGTGRGRHPRAHRARLHRGERREAVGERLDVVLGSESVEVQSGALWPVEASGTRTGPRTCPVVHVGTLRLSTPTIAVGLRRCRASSSVRCCCSQSTASDAPVG